MDSGIKQPLVVDKQSNPQQPALEISLLGPFQLHKIGHGEIKENRRKSQALLAWLLLESDQTHTREQLITLFWPEMDRQSGLKNLRVTLSRLRKQLADPSALEATRLDVRLRQTHKHQVDVNRFETLIAEAEQHSHQRLASCGSCLEKLKKALALYGGAFLSGLNLEVNEGFDDWLFIWRERLFLQLIDLLDKLANAYMDRGEYDQALIYTRRQLELDPLYDRAQKRLLRLLALQKNVSAALNQFKQLELRLKMEMGVEPDKEMRQLVADIQAGRLDAIGQSRNESVADFRRKLSNLPENLTPFFGREPEIDQLASNLANPDYRLISIIGPGGIGKSRLALEVARNNQSLFADGAFFIPLAPLNRVDLISTAIGQVIGCQFQSARKSIEDQLIEFINNKKMLLVIDNIEHLLGGVDLLLAILRRCPEVFLLVTSRRMLDVQAEDLFQLQGLPFPKDKLNAESVNQYAAVRLFCNRARRLLKSFRLTAENQAEIIEICRLTEGMPLALELAAGWIRDMPLSDLISSIKQGHSILQSTSRDIAPQHRSIQAVFEYSWQLLSHEEQELLAALSIFRGGFTAKAISEIVGSAPIDLIRLCNHSLVRRVSGFGRYELHELTRQFAAGKLAQDRTGQTETEQKYASYFLNLLTEESLPLIHTEPIAAFSRLEANFDNIRTAWERGVTYRLFHQLNDAIQGFVHFHIRAGRSREAIDIFRRNLNDLENDGLNKDVEISRCFLLTFEGYLLSRLKDKEAEDVTQKALALAKQISNLYLLTFNFYVWGWNLNGQGKRYEALKVLGQGEKLADLHQFSDILILIFRAKGNCHFVNKDFKNAQKYCEQAVELCKKHNLYPAVKAQALGELGNVSSDLGFHEKSLEYQKRALVMLESSGSPRDRAMILHYLACIQHKIGLNEAVIQNEQAAIKLCEEIGDHNLKTWAQIVLASGLRRTGHAEEAIQLLDRFMRDAEKHLFSRETALVMLEIGNSYQAVQQWAKAHDAYQKGVEHLVGGDDLNDLFVAQAALAYAKTEINDLSGAFEIVDRLVIELEAIDTSGWDDRIQFYLRCILVLKAAGDDRAVELLREGKLILDGMLSKIKSVEIRQAIIENIPEHRELLDLASQI